MDDEAAAGASPKPDAEPAHLETKEDAETRAARRELKQSTISDQPQPTASGDSPADDDAARPATPPADAPEADQLLSPKKKRAHDQLDQDRPVEETDATSVASTDSAKDRTSRSEPEKKRPRDDEESSDQKLKPGPTDDQVDGEEAAKDAGTSPNKKLQQASESSFATSSFGKLSSGSSPFASLGGSSKGTGFASLTGSTLASFASPPTTSQIPSAPAAAPKLSFGGGNAASPFAGLSKPSNGFGGALSAGSGFGASFGAKPLNSFAAPGAKPFQSDRPAKPFGAPGSDHEEDDSDDAEADTPPEETERAASPEKDGEEKRKLKLQKIAVNDGEAGEATVTSVRAKMFYHDKEAGWKERGAGMLKINVPQACVDFEESGAVIPGSFDASALEADDADQGVPRLVMRQDQTHRVILNTAIVPAMTFQEKASLKSVSVLFTAFEGTPAKPVSITMRMTAANAKSFLSELDLIQRELRGN